MKENVISVLGYMTESITPKRLLEDVQIAGMTREEQFKLFMKKTWWMQIFIAFLLLVIFPILMVFITKEKGFSSMDFRTAIALGSFTLILFNILCMNGIRKMYMPSEQYALKDIQRAYKAFIRDLVSFGAYELNNHEEDFLPITQNWINTNEDAKEFVKKVQAVRDIPRVKGWHTHYAPWWEEYKESYEWFQNLSSFVPKLTL